MKANKSKRTTTLLWPIDVFDENLNADNKIPTLVSALFGSRVNLLPTYMLDFVAPGTLPQVSKATYKKWQSHFEKSAKKKMLDFVASMKWPVKLTGNVVNKPTKSKRESVSQLLKYGKAKKADYIVISSHARKGLSRLFLGSFAETLVSSAKIPLIVVHPDSKVTQSVKNLLFATDFSDVSKAGFLKTLELAKELKAEVTLFHKLFSSTEPIVQSGIYMLGGGWVSTAQFLKDEETAKSELAKKWTALAAQKGVPVNYVSNQPDVGIAEAICETSKSKNADMIVVVNQTGRWGTVLLGSVSREILRQAPVPVLVLHK